MHSFPILQQNQINNRSEGVNNLQFPDIFSRHFCWAIIGVPGSGKTTFIQNLIQNEQLYKDKFDYILISSPSPLNVGYIDKQCITNEFKIDWFYERLNYLQSIQQQNKNVLIVLDDCISSIKHNQNDKMLQDLFFNRRHIIKNNTVSIIITTQQYTMIPAKFRGVADHFTFLSMSPKDFEYIKKELIYSSNRKCLQQVIDTFQKKHQFIYVRIQPFLLCQNFKPLIQGCDYVAISDEFDSISKSQQKQYEKEKEQSIKQQVQAPQIQDKFLFSFKKQ